MTILYYHHSTSYTTIKDLLEECKWHPLAFGDIIVTTNQDGVDLFYVNKGVDDSDIVRDYTHVFHCDDNTIPMDKSGVMFAFDHNHKRRGYRKALQWMAIAADTDIIEDIFSDAIRILDYKEERLDANDTMRFMRFCQELKNPEIGKPVVSVKEPQEAKVKIVEKIVHVPVEKVVEKIIEVPVEKIKEVIVEVPVEKVVEKRVDVYVDKDEQQKESQLLDITDSILMEYKRLGANSNEVRLLLNAVSNVHKKIRLEQVIVEPFTTQGTSNVITHNVTEVPSILTKNNTFFNELNKALKIISTTYKPLWLCAIARFVAEEKFFIIPANELAMRLLAISWEVKNSTFPMTDKVPFWQGRVADEITKIEKYSKYVDILTCLRTHKENPNIQSVLEDIYNSVMASFLKTWINSSTKSYIISRSKQLPNNCFYGIEKIKEQVYININPSWRDFVEREATKIYDFAYGRVDKILQRANCKHSEKLPNSIMTKVVEENTKGSVKSTIDDLQAANSGFAYLPFDNYVKMFSELNAKTVNGYKEPHKAVLLYAILFLIGKGYYRSNKITLNGRLEKVFENIWFDEIGIHPVFKCQVEQAFIGLENEPFCILNKAKGWVRKNSYSISDLKKYYQGGEFTPDLFWYVQDESKREKLMRILKNQYINKK